MTIAETLALFGTMAVLAAVPSASVALVVARSITLGVSHGIAVGAGIVVGDLVFIGLVMLGLTAIAETMGGMFMVVKYLGALYLLWLGLSLLMAKGSSSFAIDRAPGRGGFFASFFSGLFLTLGDIKAIFFYLSLLPLFIDLAALRLADALIVIGTTILAVGGIKVLYAIFARRVASSKRGERFTVLSTKAAGAALVGAGSYLIAKA
jgi:threonine/homoserine/homoserine lactone efflux protein